MAENLDEPTYELLFGIRRSIRYHLYRRRFYEVWNTVIVTVGVFGSSTGAALIAIKEIRDDLWWIPVVFAATVAIFSAVSLAVGVAGKANLHAELASNFAYLETRLIPIKSLDEEERGALVKERLLIEVKEPPPMRLLDVICHIEILASLGYLKSQPDICPLRRMMKNFCSQPSYAISLREKIEEV